MFKKAAEKSCWEAFVAKDSVKKKKKNWKTQGRRARGAQNKGFLLWKRPERKAD